LEVFAVNFRLVRATEGPVLNAIGIARHFGVTTMTIWRWRKAHEDFPISMMISGRRYWSLAAVEAWKAKHTDAEPHTPKSLGARADQAKAQATRARNKAERERAPSVELRPLHGSGTEVA
jgi:predicted DNA-binding transcriptional regulator AlpA